MARIAPKLQGRRLFFSELGGGSQRTRSSTGQAIPPRLATRCRNDLQRREVVLQRVPDVRVPGYPAVDAREHGVLVGETEPVEARVETAAVLDKVVIHAAVEVERRHLR